MKDKRSLGILKSALRFFKTGTGILLLLILVDLLSMGIARLLPNVQAVRESGRQAQCTSNLTQIALAMRGYRDAHNCFPAAVTTDEQGRPMRSWRIAVMPFLNRADLFEGYDFDEPWDSPINMSLEDACPKTYRCPSDPRARPCDTSYVMIVGKGTVGGEANEFTSASDISDDLANTILAIDVAGLGIPWLEPRDMTVDEAVAYITRQDRPRQLHRHPPGVNAAFADGSVRFISDQIDPQTLEHMLIRDDDQKVDSR